MKISALLIIVWYSMSIIGFDVHTCLSSGRTFIATFAKGVSCTDIHPEHHCCKSDCCGTHDHDNHETSSCCPSEQEVAAKKCCSNEYQVIDLSGCRSITETDSDDLNVRMEYPVIEYSAMDITAAAFPAEQLQFWDPDSGAIKPYDYQSVYGIWRI